MLGLSPVYHPRTQPRTQPRRCLGREPALFRSCLNNVICQASRSCPRWLSSPAYGALLLRIKEKSDDEENFGPSLSSASLHRVCAERPTRPLRTHEMSTLGRYRNKRGSVGPSVCTLFVVEATNLPSLSTTEPLPWHHRQVLCQYHTDSRNTQLSPQPRTPNGVGCWGAGTHSAFALCTLLPRSFRAPWVRRWGLDKAHRRGASFVSCFARRLRLKGGKPPSRSTGAALSQAPLFGTLSSRASWHELQAALTSHRIHTLLAPKRRARDQRLEGLHCLFWPISPVYHRSRFWLWQWLGFPDGSLECLPGSKGLRFKNGSRAVRG